MTDPLRRLSPVVRLAPAKLNLTLAVIGRRPDGFHVLHSVFAPLGLADRLSLSPAGAVRDTLHVTGHDAGPVEDNLVLRAIAATRFAVGGGWPTHVGILADQLNGVKPRPFWSTHAKLMKDFAAYVMALG